jgi:hypothetical protein
MDLAHLASSRVSIGPHPRRLVLGLVHALGAARVAAGPLGGPIIERFVAFSHHRVAPPHCGCNR